MTRAVSIAQSGANNVTMRNRIINGAMMIDQRNAGSEINPAVSGAYYVDRWYFSGSVAGKMKIGRNAGSVTPPAGFTNYLGLTSLSSYSVGTGESFYIGQPVEGFNVSDLAWGTANAKTVTLSFQVYSSVTGTFGGGVWNQGTNRSYPFTYTVSSANTWTAVSVTVPGDTAGTWATNSGIGLYVTFSVGSSSSISGAQGSWYATGTNPYYFGTATASVVGTSGATFYITGVQLEAGTTATPFEQRLYGTELALCQRYFCIFNGSASSAGLLNQALWTATTSYGVLPFPVTMRATPTGSYSALADFTTYVATVARTPTAIAIYPTNGTTGVWGSEISMDYSTGWTGGQAGWTRINKAAGYISYSAEL